LLAVSFASLCMAVDMFTRFISGKKCSTVETSVSRFPRSATAMIWLLMNGNAARFAALLPLALPRFRPVDCDMSGKATSANLAPSAGAAAGAV